MIDNFIDAYTRKPFLPSSQENLSKLQQKVNKVRSQYIFRHTDQQLHYIQTIAKIKSPILAEWTEPIALPLFLNVEYHFEIYEKH